MAEPEALPRPWPSIEAEPDATEDIDYEAMQPYPDVDVMDDDDDAGIDMGDEELDILPPVTAGEPTDG